MTGAQTNAVERLVRWTWTQYGKIGVIVDDAPGAEGAAVREIYGAERLPSWWLVARSRSCAKCILSAILKEVPPDKGERVVVIIDRYLPDRCSPESSTDGSHRRAEPWDRDDPQALPVQALGDRGVEVFLHTGYPRMRMGESEDSPPEVGPTWRHRTLGELLRVRRRLLRTRFALLSFGPAEDAPILSTRARPERFGVTRAEMARAKLRAREWWKRVQALTHVLRWRPPDEPSFLLLGWAASQRVSPLAPGYPPMVGLLEMASHFHLESYRRSSPADPHPMRVEWSPCVCQGEDVEAQPLDGRGGKALLEEYAAEGRIDAHFERDVELPRLLSESGWAKGSDDDPPHGSSEAEEREAFGESVRRVVMKLDVGHPYHYWQLAQMDWSLVATTGFDSFFERAAQSAVDSTPDLSRQQRYLARTLPRLWSDFEGPKREVDEEALARHCASGSKDRPRVLHLSESLRTAVNRLPKVGDEPVRAQFQLLAKHLTSARTDNKRTRILVLGSPVADQPDKNIVDGCDIIWVSEQALTTSWADWVRDHNNHVAIHAPPHEFVFDLWRSMLSFSLYPDEATFLFKNVHADNALDQGLLNDVNELLKKGAPVFESSRHKRSEESWFHYHLFRVDGRPAACGRLWQAGTVDSSTPQPSVLWVLDQATVTPELRGFGLGEKLIVHIVRVVERMAKGQPYCLEVAAPKAAGRFFERHRFVEKADAQRPGWVWWRRARGGSVEPVKAPRVMISHVHSESRELLAKVAYELSHRGLILWIDSWELEGGDAIPEEVVKAIKEADAIVAIVTENYVGKAWTRLERAIAEKSLDKRIYYIRDAPSSFLPPPGAQDLVIDASRRNDLPRQLKVLASRIRTDWERSAASSDVP